MVEISAPEPVEPKLVGATQRTRRGDAVVTNDPPFTVDTSSPG